MKYFIYAVSLWAFLTLTLFSREWTNLEGKVIEADMKTAGEEKVVLFVGGKEFSVPLRTLSSEDRNFVKEELQRRKKRAEEEAKVFMGQEIRRGKLITFEWTLSEENQKIAREGLSGWGEGYSKHYSGEWLGALAQGHDIEKVNIALGFPNSFDPTKRYPIFVQWSTSSGSKSHVKGARSYWPSCNQKDWILVSVEGSPDSAATWSNSVFYAGIKEFFEQFHKKYPDINSPQLQVATGGFSGGAKICQWMGGLMHELDGVEVRGYWLGGCNEWLFQYSSEDLNLSRSVYKHRKLYLSTGDADKLVSPKHKSIIEEGASKADMELKSKSYAGGHRKNTEQFEEALSWFY